ncbi:hypothetical protein GCM10010269_80500 [Streptomyces humidus]|uniref:Uncharacterized protein n=1 Tax=Streptomyces humidus TaxID=52259 RepID=A0A918GCB3_9ACTN|nr:hypothetical protein GCM10010269_80500 [Streptomyces humidus]
MDAPVRRTISANSASSSPSPTGGSPALVTWHLRHREGEVSGRPARALRSARGADRHAGRDRTRPYQDATPAAGRRHAVRR